MALNRLTSAEMISISAQWVEPKGAARKAIQSAKEAAGVLGRIDAAHAGLLATQALPTPVGRLAAIRDEAALTDLRHDTVARAADTILAGWILATTDPGRAEALQRLRDLLLPDGLSATQRSYRDEAGQGALLDERLGARERAELKGIPVLKHTLLDLVTERITCAQTLGRLEDERSALTRSCAPLPSQADVMVARNRWIRTVNALASLLDLAEADAATCELILGPLRQAERAAQRRAGRKPETETTSETPATPGASSLTRGS